MVFAEALHWPGEEHLIGVLKLFLVGDVLVHGVDHPRIPSTMILFLVLVASVWWVSALHGHRFLLERKDDLEREVKHANDDQENDALLVESLPWGEHAVLPEDVGWLGGLLNFDLVSK